MPRMTLKQAQARIAELESQSEEKTLFRVKSRNKVYEDCAVLSFKVAGEPAEIWFSQKKGTPNMFMTKLVISNKSKIIPMLIKRRDKETAIEKTSMSWTGSMVLGGTKPKAKF